MPRGRVTTVQGPGGGGLLLRVSSTVLAAGERVLWVDGAGTLHAEAAPAGLLVAREIERAAALTETVLRRPGFGLVVLSGTDLSPKFGTRLGRAAERGGAALVLHESGLPPAVLRIRGEVWAEDPGPSPGSLDSVPVRLHLQGARSPFVDLLLPVETHAVRLSLDPDLVDRRGRTG